MKVKYLPYQPHCFAFGGFEIQMLSTFNALKSIDINVEKMDVWDRDTDFDILHCWGIDIANYENVYWAKRAKKKVVVTALISYLESVKQLSKFSLSSLFYKQRLVKEMIKSIDRIVLVNEKQAKVLHKFYNAPLSKIEIIPNIVDDVFFNLQNQTMSKLKNGHNILCVGNICSRKNQIQLTKACIDNQTPLTLIGKTIPGEEQYASRLEDIIANVSNIKWIKGLKENSDELLKHIADCGALALPSYMEQQPISLLEAAVLNKPLIIADRAYAKQKYYNNSMLVDPGSVRSIKNGINLVLNSPDNYKPDLNLLLECKASNVAEAYSRVYKNL